MTETQPWPRVHRSTRSSKDGAGQHAGDRGRIEQRTVHCSTLPSAGSLQPGNRSMLRTHSRLAKSRTHSRRANSRSVGQPMLCRQRLGRTISAVEHKIVAWNNSSRQCSAVMAFRGPRIRSEMVTCTCATRACARAHAHCWHNWNSLDALHACMFGMHCSTLPSADIFHAVQSWLSSYHATAVSHAHVHIYTHACARAHTPLAQLV